VASISLSYLGDTQLELIEPVRGPNIYSDFLRDNGPGLHHICVEADSLEDFDATLATASEQGAEVAQQGVMPGGLRFAYLSAPQAGVPFLEIAHFSTEMRQFFDYIKQEQR
jgi:catechol 2,3-dioxygenase-like lactoylglutathione lyase family enzyme